MIHLSIMNMLNVAKPIEYAETHTDYWILSHTQVGSYIY